MWEWIKSQPVLSWIAIISLIVAVLRLLGRKYIVEIAKYIVKIATNLISRIDASMKSFVWWKVFGIAVVATLILIYGYSFAKKGGEWWNSVSLSVRGVPVGYFVTADMITSGTIGPQESPAYDSGNRIERLQEGHRTLFEIPGIGDLESNDNVIVTIGILSSDAGQYRLQLERDDQQPVIMKPNSLCEWTVTFMDENLPYRFFATAHKVVMMTAKD